MPLHTFHQRRQPAAPFFRRRLEETGEEVAEWRFCHPAFMATAENGVDGRVRWSSGIRETVDELGHSHRSTNGGRTLAFGFALELAELDGVPVFGMQASFDELETAGWYGEVFVDAETD